jgi:excisionase family DNA binding protein
MAIQPDPNEYLRTADVARALHVSPKTVARYAQEGKLPYARTLGGHRRYPAGPIAEMAARLQADGHMTAAQVAHVA